MRIAVAGGTGVVGTFVVAAAENAGHDVVSISRRSGVDIRSGEGLAPALKGVDVIVDTTNAGTTNRAKATAFFTEVTQQLQTVGAGEGVARLVVLSIVGLERVPGYGYYEAKLAQEKVALAGPLPTTIVRATQFHEFPAQILSRTQFGPVAMMPQMKTQPVAARAVGEVLLETVVTPPVATMTEVAGPEVAELVDLARMVMRSRGARAWVIPLTLPGRAGKSFRNGDQLPGADVRRVGPRFSEWLRGGDLERVGS
jgi:uncharacterized protein YbjT (DUF2867 family)